MSRPRNFLELGGPVLLAMLVAFVVTCATGGLSHSLIEPDEGGHYVNALFLGDWLRAGLPSPMPFARSFYAHFPRLSIGHWPPGWYMLEAPLFALLRPTPFQASLLSALLAGSPALAIAWSARQAGHRRLGAALALAYAGLPLTLDGARYILLDQPLALLVSLAAIAWAAASARPDWRRSLAFALIAAACPLVKGNGALVALLPLFDIALTRRWALLRQPALWGAGLVAMAIVAPWYWLSFRISAEGFNYQPGFGYAWAALQANLSTMAGNVGWAGLLLMVAGAAMPRALARERRIADLSLAVMAATLVFQSIVPAALAPRYCAPLLPWLVVLAGLGLSRLYAMGWPGRAAMAALAGLALLPSLFAIGALRPKADVDADTLAKHMVARGGLYLVDGRSGAEGSLIAAAAHADGGRRRVWVARASQWLSTSDFMGRGYRLTATTPAQVRHVLDRLGAIGVVQVADNYRLTYPHSQLLLRAMHERAFVQVTRPFRTGHGMVYIVARRDVARPNAALLAADPISAKVGRMAGALE